MKMLTIGVGKTLQLPLDAVTETIGIIGIKGSGKTTTAKVVVEELTKANLQCVIIDPLGVWHGLKSSADGKSAGLPFTVLGGRRADVPITEDAGALIADLVLESDSPLVIDLSGMRKAAQRRFMTAFIEQLYHAAEGKKAIHVVVDECDLYIPQRAIKGAEVLVGAMEDLVRRGRNKGLGVTLISQRPAVINKDVLSQVSVLVAHRLTGPNDITAVYDWVSANADSLPLRDLRVRLNTLPTGRALWWSPSWLDISKIIQTRLPDTFDSSSTPKPGVRVIEPKVLAKPDIEALTERMASVIAKAEENDPKALKRQVAELRRQLAAVAVQQPAVVQTTVIETVTKEVIPAGLSDRLLSVTKIGDDISALVSQTGERINVMILEYQGEAKKCLEWAAGFDVAQLPSVNQAIKPAAPRIPATPTPPRPKASAPPAPDRSGERSPLRSGARRMLEVLGRHHPMLLTKSQLGTLSKMKTTSGTFSTYKSDLVRGGYVTIEGDIWTITEAGFDVIGGQVQSAPLTTEELLAMWQDRLRSGARRMLDELVRIYPNTITRVELGEAVEVSSTSGTFSTYLSDLRRNGLAEVDGSEIRASEALFLT